MANPYADLIEQEPAQNPYSDLQAPTSEAERNRNRLGAVLQYGPDVLRGLRIPIDAGAQLLTRGLVAAAPAGSAFERWAQGQAKDVEAINAAAKAEYEQQWGGGGIGPAIARGVGESLVGGPVLGRIAPAATVLGRTAQASGVGAGMGLLSPVEQNQEDFWTEKAKQGAIGAAVGSVLGPGTEIAGRFLGSRTPESVKLLMREKVYPTAGELLGSSAKRIEEALVSLPIMGDIIKGGQARTAEQFNKAIYARALAPLGQEGQSVLKSVEPGYSGIAKVGDALSAEYERVLANSAPSQVTPAFSRALTNIAGMVPEGQLKSYTQAIRENVVKKMTPAGTLTPSAAQEAESELGRLASTYSRSAVGSEQELGRALGQAREEVRTLVAQNNPQFADHIKELNKGWATLVQAEIAAGRAGAKGGVFSPNDFAASVRSQSQGVRRGGAGRQYVRGGALNQDIAQAGQEVLSSRLPDSGTIMRGLVSAAALGGGLGAVNPAAAGVGAALSAPYMPGLQTAFAKLVAQRPDLLRKLGSELSNISPYLAAPTTAGLLSSYGGF